MTGQGATVVHATCVCFSGRAVLILGPSGAGKSALGLQLMALGAALVADDRVALDARDGALVASAPAGLPAAIEARGLGLLHAQLHGPARVVLAVDLGRAETARLPPRHHLHLCGQSVELVCGPVSGHFPAAIRQYMLAGRKD